MRTGTGTLLLPSNAPQSFQSKTASGMPGFVGEPVGVHGCLVCDTHPVSNDRGVQDLAGVLQRDTSSHHGSWSPECPKLATKCTSLLVHSPHSGASISPTRGNFKSFGYGPGITVGLGGCFGCGRVPNAASRQDNCRRRSLAKSFNSCVCLRRSLIIERRFSSSRRS